MWILESKGDLFQGRRMWLKPGKQYLFGRIKKDGVSIAVDHKTVSRKHFIITVGEVDEQDVGNVYARTRITITAQASKAQTQVNGIVSTKGQAQELKFAENVIKPGAVPDDQALLIRWEPCVLTFNLLKRELKQGVLKARQDRVRELGLKAVSDFLPGITTHLVASKRNTPKGLSALVDARFIVNDSFLDAIEYVATPSDLEQEENLCPLERDFDTHWPDATKYLPPAGRELTIRSEAAYQPTENRREVFAGYTFIFTDQIQFDNLLSPITLGHGKAVRFVVQEDSTTTDDLVHCMYDAAGHKSPNPGGENGDVGDVVLVRSTRSGEQTLVQIVTETASLIVHRRAIDQSEFLDAVLAGDASVLKQPLSEDSAQDSMHLSGPSSVVSNSTVNGVSSPRPGQSVSQSSSGLRTALGPIRAAPNPLLQLGTGGQSADRNLPTSNPENNSVSDDLPLRPPTRARFVPPKKKAYEFDDEFDPDVVLPYDDSSDEAGSSLVPSQSVQHASLASPIDQHDASALNSKSVGHKNQSLKRPYSSLSDDDDDDDDDEYDELLPAAAAMKRRKLEAQGMADGAAAVSPAPRKGGIKLAAPRFSSTAEIDVKQELRATRDAERLAAQDQAAMEQEEIVLGDDGKLPIYEIHTEFVDVPAAKKGLNTVSDGSLSDRWDPKWNGRKNFKGFRRARDKTKEADGIDHRKRLHTRIIVPLVDAQQTTYGIGEQYWEKSAEEKERERRKRERDRASQKTVTTQSTSPGNMRRAHRGQNVDENRDLGSGSVSGAENSTGHTGVIDNANPDRISTSSELSPQMVRYQQEAAEIVGIKGAAKDTRASRGTRASESAPSSSPVEFKGSKRLTHAASANVGKKQKTLNARHVATDDSGDDSDDMKFQFGRGRRTAKPK